MRLFCQLVCKIIPSEKPADQFTLQQTNRLTEIILSANNSFSVYWRNAPLVKEEFIQNRKTQKKKRKEKRTVKMSVLYGFPILNLSKLFPRNKY